MLILPFFSFVHAFTLFNHWPYFLRIVTHKNCKLLTCVIPLIMSPSLLYFFPSLPTACPPFFLLMSLWISCISAPLSSLICKVTLEVCDKELLFQEAIGDFRVGRHGCGGGGHMFFWHERQLLIK